jgi:molecular chaperone GrpE
MAKHTRDEPHEPRPDDPEDADEAVEPRVDAPDGDDPRSALERERDELRAQWQRAQADYQNLRRRLQSDIDAAVLRAKTPLYDSLLLVLDYLDMALATPCTTRECQSLLAGVEMTRDTLLRALEKENVRAVPENGAFDAAVHQAVERVETSERPAGELIEVLRRGYLAGNQVLRPAQVKVAVEPSSGGAARSSGEETS